MESYKHWYNSSIRKSNTIGKVQHGTHFYEDLDQTLITQHHDGDLHLAQMKQATFWVSFDRRYGTDVIVGYEVKYEGLSHHSDDEGYVHKRICDQGIHNNAHAKTFEFQDGEYIIHLGASAGASLDRIEFTTNHERNFKVGGNGGTYNKCITSDSH